MKYKCNICQDRPIYPQYGMAPTSDIQHKKGNDIYRRYLPIETWEEENFEPCDEHKNRKFSYFDDLVKVYPEWDEDKIIMGTYTKCPGCGRADAPELL